MATASLKVARGQIKSKLTRFKSYLDSLNPENLSDSEYSQLKVRLNRIEPCLDEFEGIQNQLINETPSEADTNDQEEFETLYFLLIAEGRKLLGLDKRDVNNGSVISGSNLNASSSNSSNYKLPPIKLPTFEGRYQDWAEYKDAFLAVVHGDPSLSESQKFYYLRSTLGRDALEVIKSISVSAENYVTAWTLLQERFENKGLSIHNHIKSIVEYPQLKHESYKELRALYDTFKRHLRSLETLGEKVDAWDRLIIYILAKKFDNTTRRDWEMFKCENELPQMNDMHKFLKNKCEVLEKIEAHKGEGHSFQNKNKFMPNKRGLFSPSLVTNNNSELCAYCKQCHSINNCSTFLRLGVKQRIQEIKQKRVCLNCLQGNHISVNCKVPKCARCNKPHHVLLHLEYQQKSPQKANTDNVSNPSLSEVLNEGNTAGGHQNGNSTSAQRSTDDGGTALTVSKRHPPETGPVDNRMRQEQVQVLLSTAIINIVINGKLVPARVLLDSGSTSHFIRQELCDKLNIKKYKTNHVVNGIGQHATRISTQTNITISSLYDNISMDIDCLIIPCITDKLPKLSFDQGLLNIPSSFELADPSYNISSEIDILLGSQVFWSILRPGQVKLGKNMPILQNTAFGWVLAGNLMCQNELNNVSNSSVSYVSALNKIDEQITKFWAIEEVPSKTKLLSDSEKYCELIFENTTKRDSDGRFVVNIPFKESLAKLGQSRENALRRFKNLENKLIRNEALRNEYVTFMEEYKTLGHMTELEQTSTNLNTGYFLPHHAVIKSTSTTTKCRVVFDASAKTDSGLSLNDVQFVGPTLQNDIFSILIRFRQFKYVMTADISKMYRQILVNEEQQCYQKIFWRAHTDEPIKLYKLNTVTYGCASSPYLAVRCIHQLAKECESESPKISRIIYNSFYVDDLLTGANSSKELVQIQKDISNKLNSAGLELRKWLCNDHNILREFSVNEDLPVSILHIGENENNKTLGIFWNASYDNIQYSIGNFDNNISQISKRKILSMVCQIYDPLGLLGPVTISAKLLIQQLWRLKISWDANVPEYILNKWIHFQKELTSINKLKIPRHAWLSEYVSIEIHGFADASERAYGACLYIRCVNISKNNISVKLLCSKTRVAPIKQPISLPRLELSACVLLANLTKKVTDSLETKFNRQYFWTDSSVTVAWLKGDITKWKTFVANRVSEIITLTNKSDWYHISTKENPADLLSRGCSPSMLCEEALWWQGPDWLRLPHSEWKLSKINVDFHNVPEQKGIAAFTIKVKNDIFLQVIERHSNLKKILRVVAYVSRFIQCLKNALAKRKSEPGLKDKITENKFCPDIVLKANEIENSLLTLIKIVQIDSFSDDYHNLLRNNSLDSKSKLLCLNPFIHNSIIRVGGRLDNTNLAFEKRHQIILPKGHKVTELILRDEHERLVHCGVQQLMCSIRERFWPLAARSSCKKVIKSCIACFRAKPRGLNYLMGNLPALRVEANHPFLNVGIDYGGPFLLKDRQTRNAKVIKGYVCLIVCLSTKAIHLELVTDLTTAAFLNALKRFVSRRGKPANIYSDNGRNFVGANAELQRLYNFLDSESSVIANSLANERIQWHFIPARSPSFGGLWEAGIKSAKRHLQRVLGNNALTYELFATLLTEVEGVLNSRPLCALTSDHEDLNALTPGHFIIGRSLTALPELSILHVPENRLDKYQRLQAMLQHFWSRWHKEYLNELQTRGKWRQHTGNVKIGSMVLLKDENIPPFQWQLGRIIGLHPGADNIVRVVDVKVQTGVVRRAITKLCPLPIEC